MIIRGRRKGFKVGPGNKEHSLNLPFWRDNNKLWALPIEPEEMDIKELIWMMDIPFWEDKDGNIVITPNEVIKNPAKFPEHKELIDRCDISYPIHITKNNLNEWLILDGLHRLAKLVREGKKKVVVKKVTRKQIWLTKMEER